jgi:phage terminase small subunit
MKEKLTFKQKRFADLYIESCNAIEAHLEIYQRKSEAGARASASKLLTNPNIVRYICDRRAVKDSAVLQRQVAAQKENIPRRYPYTPRRGRELYVQQNLIKNIKWH